MADYDVPEGCFPGGTQDQRRDQSRYVPELLIYAGKMVQMEALPVCTDGQHPTVRLNDMN